jgi:flagellar motor switch protein FliM
MAGRDHAEIETPVQARPHLRGRVRSDDLRPAEVDPDRPFPTARGVLSKAEIEALLRPDLPEPEPEVAPEQVAPRPVQDLGRAGGSARDETGHDMACAEALAARLSLSLRRDGGLAAALTVKAVDRGSFRNALPTADPGAAFACFGTPDGDVTAILALGGPLAAAMIDAGCGAAPDLLNSTPIRSLTDLDMRLLSEQLAPLARHLPGGDFICLETRSAFALALAPPCAAVGVSLSVSLDGLDGHADLVVNALPERDATPAGQQPMRDADAASPVPSGAPDGATPQSALLPRDRAPGSRELTALLTARVASLSVPVSRLADLKPGDTLLLGLPPDEPVQLLSGGRQGGVAAEGEVGRKGERMAVRITRRGPAIG